MVYGVWVSLMGAGRDAKGAEGAHLILNTQPLHHNPGTLGPVPPSMLVGFKGAGRDAMGAEGAHSIHNTQP